MMVFRRLLSLGLVCVAASLPALATGGEKGDWELGVFTGYGFLDDYGTGTSALNPDDDLLYGLRLGTFMSPRWSLELSGQRLSSRTNFDPMLAVPDVDLDIDSWRLNLLHNFRPAQTFRPFVTFGGGLERLDVQGGADTSDAGYNVGGGLRWFLGETFGLRLDARWVSADVEGLSDRQENLETAVGVLWAFGGKQPTDSDGDGVLDRRDRCPDTPRGAQVDEKGCPKDSDGDGVYDGIDQCPDTPAGTPVDAKGCPKDSDGDGVHDGIDECPDTPAGAKVDAKGCPKDSDGDGVFDGIDQCPDTPAGAKVDAKGCPKDSDGDGVFDGIDQCPGTPAGAEVDAKGCPKDSDGDGVFDGIDKCPGTPAGTEVDAKGCKKLFEDQRRSLVLEGVNFEFDSALLTAKAKGILDRVALSLQQWPEVRVQVAGHTDSVGNDGYNLRLSQQRAEAVRDYLAGKGVDGARMTAKGYGETQPLTDNKTEASRDKNRRVELERLD